MSEQYRIVAIECKKHDSPFAFFGHFSRPWIVGLENSVSIFMNGFNDAALDSRKLFESLDIGKSEMVTFANVGYHSNIAHVEAEPFAKDSTAGCL